MSVLLQRNVIAYNRGISFCKLSFIRKNSAGTVVEKESADDLPVYEYGVGGAGDRKLYVWGLVEHGGLGVHHLLRKKRIPPQYYQRPSSHNLAHICKINDIACGYGFSLFAVKKDKVRLLGCGINTDGQIGYHAPRRDHPLGLVQTPSPIELVGRGRGEQGGDVRVVRMAAGRAHSLVLTAEHGLFTLGNNAYGQCARAVVQGEDYAQSHKGASPHNIRHLGGQQITDVCCGQDHSLMLTADGVVWACGWGVDGQTGQEGRLEAINDRPKPVACGDVKGQRIVKMASKGDFVLVLSDEGDVFGWGNNEYRQVLGDAAGDRLQLHTPVHLSQLRQVAGRITDIAAGGSFAMALDESGCVWVWGMGVLGGGPQLMRCSAPHPLPRALFGGAEVEVQGVGCGLYSMWAVTIQGHLYMWGKNKAACLGLGHTKDQYFPFKVGVGAHVLKVDSGVDHTLALCKPFA